MTLIRTADLTGAALDWAVGRALGWVSYPDDSEERGTRWHCDPVRAPFGPARPVASFRPSTDWAQCGPLIDAHDVALVGGERKHPERKRLAVSAIASAYGPDNLTAACRCIVWGTLGDTVDVPEGLL